MKKIILIICCIVLGILIYNKYNIKTLNNDNIVVEINEGLTPVVYDENKKSWRIIKEDEQWYN